jgi:hypothetical protein
MQTEQARVELSNHRVRMISAPATTKALVKEQFYEVRDKGGNWIVQVSNRP